jgi:penicillin-binding protein 2
MRNFDNEKRKYVLGAVVVGVLLVYVAQLFNLQILSDEYKDKADSNAFYKKTLYPARGLMYDRKGRLLVYNQPAYDITFIPREIRNSNISTFAVFTAISAAFIALAAE